MNVVMFPICDRRRRRRRLKGIPPGQTQTICDRNMGEKRVLFLS